MGVGGLKLIENDDEKKLRGIFPCVDLSFHMISEIFLAFCQYYEKLWSDSSFYLFFAEAESLLVNIKKSEDPAKNKLLLIFFCLRYTRLMSSHSIST